MTTQRRTRTKGNGEGSVGKFCRPECSRDADGRCTSHRGTWRLRVWDENHERKTLYFKTEREAKDALKVTQRRKDEGCSVVPGRHTMAQLFDAWLEHFRQQVDRGERSLNTWRQYESYVREHMRPALGRLDCRRLTARDVDDFLGSIPLSAEARANQRAVLRRVLNVVKKWTWVDQNVVQDTDAIPTRPREIAALSLTDAQGLLDALKADRLYSAFVVALYTGLRAGELAGLCVEDIDIQAGTAHVHQQVQGVPGEGLAVKPLKTHASSAHLELIPEAIAVLADAISGRTEGYVWESAHGRPYWPTSFTQALTRALKRAGLPHVRLHDLRHYFISFLPQLDVHPAVAQKLARHASIGTTMNVYTSIEDGLKKQAMGRLHDALQNATGPSTGLREVVEIR